MTSLSYDNFQLINEALKNSDIEQIKMCFSNTKFLNAIYFSSNSFYNTALQWLENESIVYDSSDKVLQSLYNFYIRMCCRSTPYGLFAGFSIGDTYHGSTKIELSDINIVPKVRADMLLLKKIKDGIINQADSNNISLFSNNTIYNFGNMWRYISWNEHYDYEISEIPQDNILDSILNMAKNGTTIHEIKGFINEKLLNIPKAEVEDYIELLLEHKILVDRLPPYMTSEKDPLIELENSLSKNKYNTEILKSLIKIQDKISSDFYKSHFIIERIEGFKSKYPNIIDENQQVFQIDTKLNLKSKLINKDALLLLAKRAKKLFPLIRNAVDHRMQTFTNKFLEKFDRKEIPLVMALDPDFGVGYGFYISGNLEETPLLNDLHFSYRNTKKDVFNVSPIIRLLLNKYNHCFSSQNKAPIVLSDEDLENSKLRQDTLPSFGFNSHIYGAFICESQKKH